MIMRRRATGVARASDHARFSTIDQALGGVIKQLVSWTLRAPPPRPPSESAPYEIERYRNPSNTVIDTQNCPKGNDASMVPYVEE